MKRRDLTSSACVPAPRSIDRIKGGDVVWSLWGLLMRQAVAVSIRALSNSTS